MRLLMVLGERGCDALRHFTANPVCGTNLGLRRPDLSSATAAGIARNVAGALRGAAP